jgi:hypothetical protein
MDANRDDPRSALERQRELERGIDLAADDDPAFEAKVLRSFVSGGRLVRMPARLRKKGVILRHILGDVLPDDRAIEEPELNARLARWNPDVAALRRYLVDGGLVDRAGMTYRRSAARPPRSTARPPRSDRPDV